MLIYLVDLAHDYFDMLQYTPTGIGYLASFCQSKLKNKSKFKLFKSTTKFLDALDQQKPDLIGLSNYTWNTGLNHFVGKYIREKFPQMPIVMGGPNIRIDRKGIEKFLRDHSYVDKYCMFAGETSLLEIILFLIENNRNKRSSNDLRPQVFNGTYSIWQDHLIGNSNYYAHTNLDEISSPFLNHMMDEFIEKGFIPIFETNRGCPFTCTFCVWGISALNKLRQFSLERVQRELDYVVFSGFKSPILCFGDANFGILKRDVKIAQHIRQLYDQTHSFSSVLFYWSKTAQSHMVDIGRILGHLTQTYIAFQSLDSHVLENIKRKNISTDKLLQLIKQLKAFTNSTQTDILLGLPGETYESHLNSLETALKYGIDLIHGGEIRMLPGAEMDTEEQRMKFGLKTKYRLFEGGLGFYRGQFVCELEEGIRATHAMSEAEMLQLRTLRTIFYASITLGEHLPLVAYFKDRGIKVTDFCKMILEKGTLHPLFGKHLEWLNKKAQEEWFDSPKDVEIYLNEKKNYMALLTHNTFLKLNIGFLAKIYQDAHLYEAYYETTREVLWNLCPNKDHPLLMELFYICKERNFLIPCLRNVPNPVISKKFKLSKEALQTLVNGAFLPETDPALQSGILELSLSETTAKLCTDFIIQHGQNLTLLKLSQMMLIQAGRFMMKPTKRYLQMSPFRDDFHDESKVIFFSMKTEDLSKKITSRR